MGTMFIVKQVVGSKVDAVKESLGGIVGAIGGDDKSPEELAAEADAARKELVRQQEEARMIKFGQIEAERERLRDEIRKKYKMEKKVVTEDDDDYDPDERVSPLAEAALNFKEAPAPAVEGEAPGGAGGVDGEEDQLDVVANKMEEKAAALKEKCIVQ